MENAGRVEYTQNEELNRIHEPGAKSRHKITEHDIDSGTPARVLFDYIGDVNPPHRSAPAHIRLSSAETSTTFVPVQNVDTEVNPEQFGCAALREDLPFRLS
ncbi:unnamed protein product [Heligmosomoides polygyrus]|uniref:Uncharacterized protein n=1 Tax=Heligmosomoides polygyrus TaxID=6339 RepID=A0A183G814_HELPZ|nr:unnamed protein product [Heligmosomoides polygyrus]